MNELDVYVLLDSVNGEVVGIYQSRDDAEYVKQHCEALDMNEYYDWYCFVGSQYSFKVFSDLSSYSIVEDVVYLANVKR